MDFERKSERNQRICEEYKLVRKQQKALRPKVPAPRFGPGVKVPEIPEGMELHKFYGEPVLLPAKTEDEELVGRMSYTQRQIEILKVLLEQRNHTKI